MTRMMRAALFESFGSPAVVEVKKVPIPEPGPGEVRIKVEASAMNHLDLWVRRGLPIEAPMPHIGGSDIAGLVDMAGTGAVGVPLGARVVVDPSLDYDWYEAQDRGPSFNDSPFQIIGEHTQGGFAEYVVVPASNILQVPEHVGSVKAAAAGLVFVTAWRALMTRGRLKLGETVLITGASGGVGTAAIQIARRSGAKVFAVTGGVENVARIQALGADVVYDRFETSFSREIWRDTSKRGVDVVFDTVGEETWPDCLRALSRGGRLVTAGATTGSRGATDVGLVFWKQLEILGSTMGTPAEFRKVMRLVFEGVFDPVIQEVMPLKDARRAHETLEEGNVFGKLVLVP
ncbi:zinc-binding dehydrogenase [Gemmatimonadales bacterium]|nr:zinc-binding dehydrogenase [Gemmatimonadales bacterium]